MFYSLDDSEGFFCPKIIRIGCAEFELRKRFCSKYCGRNTRGRHIAGGECSKELEIVREQSSIIMECSMSSPNESETSRMNT